MKKVDKEEKGEEEMENLEKDFCKAPWNSTRICKGTCQKIA